MEQEDSIELVQRAADGDEDAWLLLVRNHGSRIKRMLELRLDHRLSTRLDASDIFQEALVRALSRLQEFLDHRPATFFLWLRYLAGQELVAAHRHHLGAQKRDASMELRRLWGGCPLASSQSIIRHLVGRDLTPSRLVMHMEEEERLRKALDELSSETREILALRHFEHLSNAEAAHVMGINPSTASSRYLAALRSLKNLLPDLGAVP